MRNRNLSLWNFRKSLVTGISLITLAIFTLIFDFSSFIDHHSKLLPGTIFFKLWQKPPFDVFVSFHFFNVTNSEAFLNGTDTKLNLTECGPYVYKEILSEENATFHENGTLSYVPTRRYVYIPEKSSGDVESDILIIPNIWLIGALQTASKVSFLTSAVISKLSEHLGTKVFLNMTVHEALFGYTDEFTNFVSKINPAAFYNGQMSYFNELTSREKDNTFTMHLSESENLRKTKWEEELDVEYDSSADDLDEYPKEYSLNFINGNRNLPFWKSRVFDGCSSLHNAFDGTILPRNLSKHEDLKLYRSSACRTYDYEYTESSFHYGNEFYHFTPKVLSDEDCLCQDSTCSLSGIGSVAQCHGGLPIAISFPHFYKANANLVEQFNGLHPDKEKHEGLLVYEPRLGIITKAKVGFQMNLVAGDITYNEQVKRFENQVHPMLWVRLDMNLMSTWFHLTLLIIKNVKISKMILVFILFSFSSFCLYYSTRCKFRRANCNSIYLRDELENNSLLKR